MENLGRVLLGAGHPAEAESVWSEAIRTLGDDSPADLSRLYVGLALGGGAQGRTAEAVRLLQEAVAHDPESLEGWTQLGVALFLRKDFGSAAEALKRALAIDPDAVRARRHLGLVHAALGERGAARKELERALRSDPSAVNVRIDLAVLDLSDGRADQALLRLEGLELEGEDGDRLRFYRGVALDLAGEEDEALDLLRPLADRIFGRYAAEARDDLSGRFRA